MDHEFTISGVTDVAVVRDKAVGEIKSHNRTGFSQIVGVLSTQNNIASDALSPLHLCTNMGQWVW